MGNFLKNIHPLLKRTRSDSNYDGANYAILNALSEVLGELEQEAMDSKMQSSLETATGEWLDRWGDWFGVYRKEDETDEKYRARIIRYVLLKRGTIPAIIDAIKDFLDDPDANIQIYEPWKNIFYTNKSLLNGPDHLMGHYYRYGVIDISMDRPFPPEIGEVIDRFKPAGVKWLLRLDSGNSENAKVVEMPQADMEVFVDTWLDRLTGLGYTMKGQVLTGDANGSGELANIFYTNKSLLNGPDVLAGSPTRGRKWANYLGHEYNLEDFENLVDSGTGDGLLTWEPWTGSTIGKPTIGTGVLVERAQSGNPYGIRSNEFSVVKGEKYVAYVDTRDGIGTPKLSYSYLTYASGSSSSLGVTEDIPGPTEDRRRVKITFWATQTEKARLLIGADDRSISRLTKVTMNFEGKQTNDLTGNPHVLANTGRPVIVDYKEQVNEFVQPSYNLINSPTSDYANATSVLGQIIQIRTTWDVEEDLKRRFPELRKKDHGFFRSITDNLRVRMTAFGRKGLEYTCYFRIWGHGTTNKWAGGAVNTTSEMQDLMYLQYINTYDQYVSSEGKLTTLLYTEPSGGPEELSRVDIRGTQLEHTLSTTTYASFVVDNIKLTKGEPKDKQWTPSLKDKGLPWKPNMNEDLIGVQNKLVEAPDTAYLGLEKGDGINYIMPAGKDPNSLYYIMDIREHLVSHKRREYQSIMGDNPNIVDVIKYAKFIEFPVITTTIKSPTAPNKKTITYLEIYDLSMSTWRTVTTKEVGASYETVVGELGGFNGLVNAKGLSYIRVRCENDVVETELHIDSLVFQYTTELPSGKEVTSTMEAEGYTERIGPDSYSVASPERITLGLGASTRVPVTFDPPVASEFCKVEGSTQTDASVLKVEGETVTAIANVNSKTNVSENLLVRVDEVRHTAVGAGDLMPYAGSTTMRNLIPVKSGERLVFLKESAVPDPSSINFWRYCFLRDNRVVVSRHTSPDQRHAIIVPEGSTWLMVSYPTEERCKISKTSDNIPEGWTPSVLDGGAVSRVTLGYPKEQSTSTEVNVRPSLVKFSLNMAHKVVGSNTLNANEMRLTGSSGTPSPLLPWTPFSQSQLPLVSYEDGVFPPGMLTGVVGNRLMIGNTWSLLSAVVNTYPEALKGMTPVDQVTRIVESLRGELRTSYWARGFLGEVPSKATAKMWVSSTANWSTSEASNSTDTLSKISFGSAFWQIVERSTGNVYTTLYSELATEGNPAKLDVDFTTFEFTIDYDKLHGLS